MKSLYFNDNKIWLDFPYVPGDLHRILNFVMPIRYPLSLAIINMLTCTSSYFNTIGFINYDIVKKSIACSTCVIVMWVIVYTKQKVETHFKRSIFVMDIIFI